MTVSDFFNLPKDEVLEVFQNIKYIKKADTYLGFKLNDIKTYPYIQVVNFTKAYTTGNIILAVNIITGIDVKKIHKSNYKNFIYFVSLLYFYLDQINELSKYLNSLKSEHDNSEYDLEQAGIEDLNKFEELNVIDELANGDITKHKEIEMIPYENVMAKLIRDKQKAVIKSNYQHIIKERSKR